MHLYYAMGGGLGHLVRAKKVLHALSVTDFKVITAHQNVPSPLFDSSQLLYIPEKWSKTPQRVMATVEKWRDALDINTILVDTFPDGILGELNLASQPSNVRKIHVARYVHWPKYQQFLMWKNRFDTALVIDELHPEQSGYIHHHAKTVKALPLNKETGSQNSHTVIKKLKNSSAQPLWVVVHSFSPIELRELISYAEETARIEKLSPHIVICTNIPQHQVSDFADKKQFSYANHYPASDFFPYADRIFTACGFNCMQETLDFTAKHQFLPFPRKYDDQFKRAAAREKTNKLRLTNHDFQ